MRCFTTILVNQADPGFRPPGRGAHLRRQAAALRRRAPSGHQRTACRAGAGRASVWCASRVAIRSSSAAGARKWSTLAAQGIDCVVVPGITAALGAASTAGIPLTHRDLAQSVRFVTGHRVNDQSEPGLAGTGQPPPNPRGLHGPAGAWRK